MVLTSHSPEYLHVLQNLALVFASLIFLPLSTALLLLSYALHPILFIRQNGLRSIPSLPSNRPVVSSTQRAVANQAPITLTTATPSYSSPPPSSTSPIILVTGIGMTKGLYLARAFHLSGLRVIGADIAPYNLIPPIGRFSRSIDNFYNLPAPTEQSGSAQYIHALLTIIRREKVSLWVSCSGVHTALDDARAKEIIHRRSDCSCIQFDVHTTQLLHEKDTFTAYAASLGLPVPETHNVTSRAAIHKVLHQSPRTKKRYIMKSVDMDDASRAEIMTVLPRRTLSETYNHIARLPISEAKPWVLQQYVPGKREYCTHSLVIRGKVRAFVACPSSDLLMHYEALPHPASPLSRAMLKFTEEFVSKSRKDGDKNEGLTGHLSFDFLVDEQVTERGVENVLRAIECNPRAHTAVALFRGREQDLVKAYLSALKGSDASGKMTNSVHNHTASKLQDQLPQHEKQQEPSPFDLPTTTAAAAPPPPADDIIFHLPATTLRPMYWIGHDIITLLLQPLLHLFALAHPQINLPTYLSYIQLFLTHLLFWQDGTYEIWDPLPAWWLYHVYCPGMFIGSLVTGRRWSRVNVSTCKMFGC